ncbi:uncharacterized protein LOC143020420 [Oratosquilla oratoria]|uniref:uncharacterized protein LOC143020420 n=1 Tax=Oratosquilla oratoria TaxID=337810 RepID=UPI003F757780
MLLEKSWEWNLTQRLVFLDLEKAFDSVPREKMWRVLSKYEIPGKLLRAVKSIYKDCKSPVKCGKEEYKWVEDRVVTLAYADDVALASQNLGERQESLNRWNNALNEYGLRLNIEKCEVMTVSREEICNLNGVQ